jgi:GrpB-like predicted nucleotidyltransferase (UPF0157 family)
MPSENATTKSTTNATPASAAVRSQLTRATRLRFSRHGAAAVNGGDAADRELYANAKRKLATRDWNYGQQSADAKTEVIGEILARARAA